MCLSVTNRHISASRYLMRQMSVRQKAINNLPDFPIPTVSGEQSQLVEADGKLLSGDACDFTDEDFGVMSFGCFFAFICSSSNNFSPGLMPVNTMSMSS
jgi:hypothetical protein